MPTGSVLPRSYHFWFALLPDGGPETDPNSIDEIRSFSPPRRGLKLLLPMGVRSPDIISLPSGCSRKRERPNRTNRIELRAARTDHYDESCGRRRYDTGTASPRWYALRGHQHTSPPFAIVADAFLQFLPVPFAQLCPWNGAPVILSWPLNDLSWSFLRPKRD